MEAAAAVQALAALAQETRLAVFRLLVQAGPEGLPAGEVAKRFGSAASTMSHHLAQLERAGIVRSRRVRRQVFYATHCEGTRRLLDFLTEDCCRGLPLSCAPDEPTDAAQPR
jgi:DNA-binding transcriptional ArsR family regulator